MANRLLSPSLHNQRIGHLVIACDTSGSMWNEQVMSGIASELEAIAATLNYDQVTLMFCDDRVTKVEELNAGDPIKFEPLGGGGTDFTPVFEKVEELGIEPDALIYVTDMAGHNAAEEPAYPVLWVDFAGGAYVKYYPPKFGRHIQVR